MNIQEIKDRISDIEEILSELESGTNGMRQILKEGTRHLDDLYRLIDDWEHELKEMSEESPK